MGCALYIRSALSIHKKECRKILGCALYIGTRYLPENAVIILIGCELWLQCGNPLAGVLVMKVVSVRCFGRLLCSATCCLCKRKSVAHAMYCSLRINK
jgi:hypothetical protein